LAALQERESEGLLANLVAQRARLQQQGEMALEGDVKAATGVGSSRPSWAHPITLFVLCPLFVVCSCMDREKLQQHLQEAERHVAQSTMHVVEQRKLVIRLERDGLDTTDARRLLELFEESLRLYLVNRDRLRRELAEYLAFTEVSRVEGPPSAPEDGTPV
jgi:hypothetical protein